MVDVFGAIAPTAAIDRPFEVYVTNGFAAGLTTPALSLGDRDLLSNVFSD
jgi:hypothetical protein